jgi:hypothetical protein
MKFSANHPIEVSGSATPLAAKVCESCAAGMGGGMDSPSVNVQSVTASGRSGSDRQI